ncbi:MAG: CPBP family glutamic-type intramembrane protease [Candidatus Dormibacteria bacterium]
MNLGQRSGNALAAPAVVLGAAAQAGLSNLSFRHPRYFWSLMTLGLSACGIPGLRRLRDRPQSTSLGWLGLGLLAGIFGYGLTILGALVVRRMPWGRRSLDQIRECTEGVARPVAALLVVPAAVGEELFWRQTVLDARHPAGSGPSFRRLVGTTLAYAAVQSGSGQPLPPLGALLLGSGAGWIKARSGSIWPAAAAHLAYTELCLVRPGLPRSQSHHSK